MTPDVQTMIARAARRAEWAAHALDAAADELHAAGELGAVVNSTAAHVRIEAQRVSNLLLLIAADREQAGDGRRARL